MKAIFRVFLTTAFCIFIGRIIGYIIYGVFYFIVSIPGGIDEFIYGANHARPLQNSTISWLDKIGAFEWLSMAGMIIGGIVGLIWGCIWASQGMEESAEKCRKEAENRQREAERQAAEDEKGRRALAKQSAERAKALSDISKLVSSAQGSASRLPTMLAAAELALDTAEQELAEGLYSPFWEAMENSALMVSEFDGTLRAIDNARNQHSRLAPPLAPDAVDFHLGISLIPDPSETMRRMNALYRQAQKDPHFAQVYEQRRTNAILVEGFRSLGEAVASLGNRLAFTLDALSRQLDFRLADVESALRESADRMEEQQSALIEVAEAARREARESSAELATIARDSADQAEKDAASRRKHETESREMLDNIQRRRKPYPQTLRDGEY